METRAEMATWLGGHGSSGSGLLSTLSPVLTSGLQRRCLRLMDPMGEPQAPLCWSAESVPENSRMHLWIPFATRESAPRPPFPQRWRGQELHREPHSAAQACTGLVQPGGYRAGAGRAAPVNSLLQTPPGSLGPCGGESQPGGNPPPCLLCCRRTWRACGGHRDPMAGTRQEPFLDEAAGGARLAEAPRCVSPAAERSSGESHPGPALALRDFRAVELQGPRCPGALATWQG